MPPFKETKKPVTKQEEPKQEEPKQEEPKQEEPKQEEPKQEEPKQEEPKQEEPKQDETKQEEPEVKEPKISTVQKLHCKSSIYIVNPFTQDRFIPNEPIDATMDSWLDCQIKAKLIEPCH